MQGSPKSMKSSDPIAKGKTSPEAPKQDRLEQIGFRIQLKFPELLQREESWVTEEHTPLRQDLLKILDKHGLDRRLAGLLARLTLRAKSEDVLGQKLLEVAFQGVLDHDDVEMLLRQAGYGQPLAAFVARLLKLSPEAQKGEVEGVPSLRALAYLIDQSDRELISLLRVWQGAGDDDKSLRKKISAVLSLFGISAELVNDVADTIHRNLDTDRLSNLARISRSAQLIEDGCISIADSSWSEDPHFAAAYEEACGISSWERDIRWRVQTLVKMASAANHLKGDFVECGVDTGGTARAVMAYLGDSAFDARRFFLFDTFHGLAKEQLTDEEEETSLIKDVRYPEVFDTVQKNFSDKPYVQIVKGTVPASLEAYTGKHVAYLHIDMNVAYPEVEALKFFWPKLAPGAPVIFDDYGFPQHQPQRKALDAIAAGFGVEITMLPTCQGLLFKPSSKTSLLNRFRERLGL